MGAREIAGIAGGVFGRGRVRRALRHRGVVPIAVTAAAVLTPAAVAGPEGETVVYGWAEFYRDGVWTTITVSDLAIIDYSSFNIESWEMVRFIQPDGTSRVLNRIDSAMPTYINGQLMANGQVFFVNPAGIYFGQGAVVDVGGIYAAAGQMSNADFLAGNNNFTGLSGPVVNHGTIRAEGSVGMVGRRVANFGSVIAGDTVVMGAGDEVLIGERDGHVFARISGGGTNTGGAATDIGVQNGGLIQAGSQAVLGVGDHFALALYDTSEIYAQAVDIKGRNGSHIQVAGTIDTTGETGGRVHVTGDYIEIDNAVIDASGELGGGAIRIGGAMQGSGHLWRAKGTWIGANTTLRADALTSGDGGRIIVWADGATGFKGTISARGGFEGGNGGFSEVSGKGWLSFDGHVDLSAPLGDKGTLLLDPTNILVFDGPAGSGDVDGTATNADFIFAAADADPGDMETSISNTDLVTLLDTADIVLQANNDIMFTGSVDASGNTGDHSLTLNAGRSILISNNVEILLRGDFNATVNDVLANADRGAGAGAFTMGTGSRIVTTFGGADGSITIESQDGFTGAELGGDFTLAELDAGTGAITLTVTGDDGTVNFVGATGGASLTGSTIELNNAMVSGDIGAVGDAIALSATTFAAASTGDVILSLGGVSEVGAVGGTTGVSSTGGSVEITSASALTVSENISIASDGQSISLDLGDLIIDFGGGAEITTGVGANRTIAITGGGGLISLGSAIGGLELTSAELAQLTANTLRFGDATTTQLTVGTVTAADFGGAGVEMRALGAGGVISFAPGAATTFEFASLDARATDEITFGADAFGLIATGAGTIFLDAGAGDVTLGESTFALGQAGNTITTASDIISVLGSFTLDGDLIVDEIANPELRLVGGTGITINGTVDSMGADVVALSGAGAFTLGGGGSVTTGGGDLTIFATDLSLGGALSAGSGDVVIDSSSAIELGIASGGGGVMHISNAELALISGASLTIGSSASTPSIRVEGVDGTAAGANVFAGLGGGAVSLEGDAISFVGASSTFTNLGVTGDVSVMLTTDLFTETGALSIASPSIDVGMDVMISSAASLALGDLTLSGAGGVVTLESGSEMGITLGSVMSTAGSGLTISSADALIAGAIDLGAGVLDITIDTGAAGATSSTLSTISAGAVTIDSDNDATIDLNGLVTTSAGAIAIDAGSGGAINLNAGGITAVGGGIDLTSATTTLGADLMSTGGSIAITGDLSIGLGRSITSGGAFSVTGATTLTGAGGAVTITTADTFGVTMASVTSTAGSGLTILSGDSASLGVISLGAGALDVTLDTGAGGATTSTFAAITAGSVSIASANDATIDLNGLVSSSAGAITLDAGSGGFVNVNSGGIASVGGGIDITGTATLLSDIAALSESITFFGDVVLGGAGARTIGIVGGNAGDLIDFRGGITALAGQGLNLDAGTGDITLGDSAADTFGVGGALGDVLITNAGTLTINGSVLAESLSAGVGGTVASVVFDNTPGTNTVTLTGQNASGLALEIDATTLVDLSSAISATSLAAGGGGIMVDAGAGTIISSGDLAIDTTGSLVFASDVVSGGDITLTLDTAALGSKTVSLQGLSGADITVQTGGGTIGITLNGAIASSGVGGVLLDAGVGGSLAFNAGSSITTTGGAIAGEGGVLLIGDLTLATDLTIDTTAAGASGGPIEIRGTTNGDVAGTRAMMLLAGDGDVTLGSVGDVVRLDALTIDAGTGTIAFRGTTYDAESQAYSAAMYDIDTLGGGTVEVLFTGNAAQAGDITFTGGTIAIGAGHNATFMTPLGSVTLADLTGLGRDLTVIASDTATLGSVGMGGALNDISITADEIDLTGAVFGSGALTLEPFTLTRDIELAGGLDAGAGFFDLTVAELSLIQDGFGSITIGRAGGTGAMGVHGFTFLDDLTLITSGAILIDGLLSNTGGSITIGDATDPTAVVTLDVGGDTITTTGGDITILGDAVLVQDTTLTTGAGGGMVSISGLTDASVAGGSSLTVNAGLGAIDLGKIGSGANLSALTLSGGDITLDGIGTLLSQGVTGLTDVTATGTLTLGGSVYHGATQSYNAAGGFVATSDLLLDADGAGASITLAGGDFMMSGFALTALTEGGDVTSTAAILGSGMTGEILTINAGAGAVALADVGTPGARLAEVSVTGATVNLNNVYTLEQIGASGDQTFTGDITLNSTYDSMGGDILFDGDVTGLSDVIVNAGSGTLTFDGEIITAPSFDLTAAFYDFTGMMPVMTATTGDIDFNGGNIRLLGPTDITFVAVGGASTNITLATITGTGSERMVATASGFIQLNGIGSSSGTGIDDAVLTASDIFFSGLTWTDRVEFRPFMAGGDILVGAGSSGSTLDITNLILSLLRGNSQVVVGRLDGFGAITLGGFSLSADLQIRTPLAGGVITVNGPVNMTGSSDIWFRGDSLVLAGNVLTQGGDITSDSGASVTGAVLLSTMGGDVNFDGSFEGLVDGDGDLAIDYGSGDINFTGGTSGYGLTNRLASLALTGDQIFLNTVRTTGDQTFTGTTFIDNLPVAGVLDSVSGDITFDGMVTIEGDSLITTGGGAISFLDLVDGAGTGMEILRLNAGGGSVLLSGAGGPGKNIESLIINAMSTGFRGDVYVADQLVINSDSVLDASAQADGVLTFCAADALFNGAITSSVSGASGLEAMVSGTTTFVGPIGQGGGRLHSISTDSAGTTIISDDISTQLGMTFADDVLIAGDVTLRSYDPTAAGSIRFLQTVNADGTPGRKLTVLTDLTLGDLVGGALNPDVAVIQFVGDIGTAVGGELAELNLNYSVSLGIDGHLVVPVNATIIFGDAAAFLAGGATRDFTVNVGEFNMGFNEKVGVPGGFTLNASTSARLGDITSVGDMFITTPAVTFLLRDFGSVYDPMSGSSALDEGLDFVSGGSQIVFTTGSISYLGSGADPIFAVAGGNVTIGDPLEIRSFDSTVPGLMSGIILLDVRSLGPTNTNVAEAIAGAVPRESQSGVVQEDTTVGVAAQEALRELGIYPRATLLDPRLTEEERTALFESVLESLLGMAIYNDMPGESEPEFTEVTVDRLELELVDEILADYRGLFRREVRDPETGEMVVEDRRKVIRDVLGDSIDAYFEALDPEDFDADQFIDFLVNGGEQTSEALGYIVELQRLFERIQLLGLSAFEVAGVKSALFGAVRPADLTASELESLLDREPIGLLEQAPQE